LRYLFLSLISDPSKFESTTTIIGSFKEDSTHISFVPLVPFDLETPYTILNNDNVYVFEVNKSEINTSMKVVEIYPNSKLVPANILKWYIKFSNPVNPVKIYEHIHFLDENGKEIDRAILNLGAPLISDDGTLLTIWIEPGRQKRMLGPHQHLGSVFKPFKHYTLYIDNTLKDKDGITIEKSINHNFTTSESDRIKPSISEWEVKPLQTNTRQPLEILINESLDFGSLYDAISIVTNSSKINGELNFDSQKNKIYFTPESNWEKGIYLIKIDPFLEDLAGNNLKHLFDRPIHKNKKEDSTKEFSITVNCF